MEVGWVAYVLFLFFIFYIVSSFFPTCLRLFFLLPFFYIQLLFLPMVEEHVLVRDSVRVIRRSESVMNCCSKCRVSSSYEVPYSTYIMSVGNWRVDFYVARATYVQGRRVVRVVRFLG